MAPSKIAISIRIRHAEYDAEVISSLLGMTPSTYWSVGDRRKSIAGKDLDGVQAFTYWVYEYPESSAKSLDKSLKRIVATLAKKASSIEKVSHSAISLELFIGFFLSGNLGFTLASPLLKQLGDLKIDLSFDIYP